MWKWQPRRRGVSRPAARPVPLRGGERQHRRFRAAETRSAERS
jgi:hypothetical protein